MSDSERLLLVASPLMNRTPAFDRAAALAKAKGVPLHIVAFDYVEGLATAGLVNEQALAEMREGYLMRHRQWLEEQAAALRNLNIVVTTEVMWVQRPLEEILRHVKELNPSMLIKDLEHESLLMRTLFTPLDLRLLRECSSALHLVAKVQHATPRKILAAVDPFKPEEQFEQFNDHIILAAEKLASQCNAELHLLYAYDLSYMYASEGMGSTIFSAGMGEAVYDAEGKAFTELADRYRVPPECRHFIMGVPAKVITAYAEEENIDVVVLGTVHRRGLNKLLGSTAEQVVYHMHSSLLAIKPSSF